jgi:hypothetical protein
MNRRKNILKIKFLKISVALSISLVLILLSSACRKVEDSESKTDVLPKATAETKSEKPIEPIFVDVPQFANKASAEFDVVFGKPVQITRIKDDPKLMPGEYRLYNIKSHPKGLSVRFYRDKAKRFNLILGTPLKSSKLALLDVFKIDIGSISPDLKSEPLSEKWRGTFNEINFATVYAKRETASGDFTMVHAEVGN